MSELARARGASALAVAGTTVVVVGRVAVLAFAIVLMVVGRVCAALAEPLYRGGEALRLVALEDGDG
jgi:hypothetical protein